MKYCKTILAGTVLALAACGKNESSSGVVRAANGIPDSSGLNVAIGTNLSIGSLAYGTASSLRDLPTGAYNAQLTDGSYLIGVNGFSVSQNSVTTLFDYGYISEPATLGGFAAVEPLDAPPGGQFAVQLIDDAYGFTGDSTGATGALYFYFDAPSTACSVGAIRGGAAPAGTAVTFGAPAAAAAIDVPAGTYAINAADSNLTYFFCGSSPVTLPSAGADIFQLALIDLQSADPAAVQVELLLLDNIGGQSVITSTDVPGVAAAR